jgi:hypothetical protein
MLAATSHRLPTNRSLQDRGLCPGIGASSPRAGTSDSAYLQAVCRPKCAGTKARAMLAIDLLQAQDVCPQALELGPQDWNAVIKSNRCVGRHIQAVDTLRSKERAGTRRGSLYSCP